MLLRRSSSRGVCACQVPVNLARLRIEQVERSPAWSHAHGRRDELRTLCTLRFFMQNDIRTEQRDHNRVTRSNKGTIVRVNPEGWGFLEDNSGKKYSFTSD